MKNLPMLTYWDEVHDVMLNSKRGLDYIALINKLNKGIEMWKNFSKIAEETEKILMDFIWTDRLWFVKHAKIKYKGTLKIKEKIKNCD